MAYAFNFFKAGKSGMVRTGIQLVRLETGEPVQASELVCYRVTAKRITTPWVQVEFQTGCRLFLADDAAADLLEAGLIEKTYDAALVKHRGGHETAGTSQWAEATGKIAEKNQFHGSSGN